MSGLLSFIAIRISPPGLFRPQEGGGRVKQAQPGGSRALCQEGDNNALVVLGEQSVKVAYEIVREDVYI